MNWFDYLNYDPSDFGSGDVGGDYNPDVVSVSGPDRLDLENLPAKTPSFDVSKLLKGLKTLGGKAADFAGTDRGLMAILAAMAAYADRARPSGGGVGTAYAGYKPLQRQMVQGKYGPIAQYAAQGGIMHAYAQGGAVNPFPMQDGGFVMTKRAVDGAGGPQGMRQRIPEAMPIRGPGTGTSDSIPAYIQGANGRTPAKVSNGEMYVPPGRDTRGLYALMRAMERKA